MVCEQMTSKERWLAALKLKDVDRLPFWPKPSQLHLTKNKSFKDVFDFFEYVGSDGYITLNPCFKEKRHKTLFNSERKGNFRRDVYATPLGKTEATYGYDAFSMSWHPIKMPVSTVEDIKLMIDWYNDCEIILNEDALQSGMDVFREVGAKGITIMNIGESPLMYFVEWLAGIENAHFLLADFPDEIDELFEAMHKVLLKKTELAAEYSSADMFCFIENTSTTLISPSQYETFCYKHINAYCDIFKTADCIVMLHMCGHLKALLPILSNVKADAFEAFTSPPLGNTTLLDGRIACSDKCLIGGTNAVLWLEDAKTIIKQIEKHLNELPHHRGIVISPAGIMPPAAEIHTIKDVCNWIKNYRICL
ncbi:MAG: uroporphyrinogen decarboxylase family protein [Firmicutes bacterium]|nr:uroporphyrinogen decarboxylase family protein [Bacillota bacterium]